MNEVHVYYHWDASQDGEDLPQHDKGDSLLSSAGAIYRLPNPAQSSRQEGRYRSIHADVEHLACL